MRSAAAHNLTLFCPQRLCWETVSPQTSEAEASSAHQLLHDGDTSNPSSSVPRLHVRPVEFTAWVNPSDCCAIIRLYFFIKGLLRPSIAFLRLWNAEASQTESSESQHNDKKDGQNECTMSKARFTVTR